MLSAEFIEKHIPSEFAHKQEAFPLCLRMADYAYLAWKSGLLALEEVLKQEEDPFLKHCLLLLLEGEDEIKLQCYMDNELLGCGYELDNPKLFFELLIISNGVREIAQGARPIAFLRNLSFWFGESFYPLFDAEVERFRLRESEDKKKHKRERFQHIHNSAYKPFDQIAQCSQAQIQSLLEQCDLATLLIALRGASYLVFQQFCDAADENLKKEIVHGVMDDRLLHIDHSPIEAAQKEILKQLLL